MSPTSYLTSALAQFAEWGERPAVVHRGVATTYADYRSTIFRTARLIAALGLRPGDRLAAVAGNAPEAMMLGLAANIVGVTYVPLFAGHSAAYVRHVLADAQPAALVWQPGAGADDDAMPAAAGQVLSIGPSGRPGIPDLRAAVLDFDPDPVDVVPGDDDLARILYTGGTTGAPKGVAFSYATLSRAAAVHPARRLPPDFRFLVVTPVMHAAGAIAFGLMRSGARVELSDTFDPDGFLARVGAASAAGALVGTYLYPAQLARLVECPAATTADLRSLASLTYGSAPAPAAVLAGAARLFGPRLTQSYAQTEAVGITALTPPDHERALRDERLFSSVGRPLPGVRVRIVADDGSAAPPGEIGRVQVSGPTVADGYWRGARSGDWHDTGDQGRLDDEGYLFLAGRSADVVTVAGVRCHPHLVEGAVGGEPGVRGCGVVLSPDGAGLLVVVQADDRGPAVAEAAVRAAVVRTVPVPADAVRVRFVAELPVTGFGKVDKAALRTR